LLFSVSFGGKNPPSPERAATTAHFQGDRAVKRSFNCPLSALVTVVCVAMVPSLLSADTIGYAVTQPSSGLPGAQDQLYSVDLTTHAATLLGTTETSPGNFVGIDALALSPNSTLYATDSAGILYTLNKTNGAATAIGGTGLGAVRGMHFLGNTLLGTNTGNPTTIYSINTTTPSSTAPVVTFTQGVSRALTLENSNTALVPSDSPTTPSLIAVNLTTGANTVRGTINTSSGTLAAMDFNSSLTTLYGLDALGNEFTINPLNGAATLVGNTGGSYFYTDLAIAPLQQSTPEPASITLLCTGFLAVGGIGLRRRKTKPSTAR
jgi:hypothetical protein